MFRKLLTFDETQRIIRRRFRLKPSGVETIPLLEADNRVLGEDVIAGLDIPPFDRSTVDGYAVKAEDTFGAGENKPAVLMFRGIVNIGELPKISVGRGEATEIVTGAPIPKGADAVVMVEHTSLEGNTVRVFTAVAKGENIMTAGSDIVKGELVLETGQLLGSREIGVLAALGIAKIRAFKVPRVAVLSTGGEVTEPGKKLTSGKIYDINAYSLSAAVLESGGKPVYLGVFPDKLDELQEALRNGLESADIIVTSGGVSVGPKDVMPKALNSLAKLGIIVCGVAIKPGKPTTIASVNGKPVFSLPGHPASALLVFYLFARPVIQSMAGKNVERGMETEAFAGMRMFPAKGRRTYIMIKLKRDKHNRLLAEPVPVSLSGAITTLAKADGFVEIPEKLQFIEADEKVTVHLLRSLENRRF